MNGRFYVKENGSKPLIVGVAIGQLLNVGNVYQIENYDGLIVLRDLGQSQIVGDKADSGSVDMLLALGEGRHCMQKELKK